MNIYQGEREQRASPYDRTMETPNRDHRHHSSGKDYPRRYSSDDGHRRSHQSSSERERYSHRPAEAKSLNEHTFPNKSMSAAYRDKKVRASAYPQQVPWPNTNEVGHEGQKPRQVKGVVKEDHDWKDQTKVSSSRVQAPGAPPSRNGASSSTRQAHYDGERIPRTTNSTRQEDHMDSQGPGTVVYGSDEDASQYSEDSRNGSQPIVARVVDPDEERRILREQVYQVLQEERAHSKHRAPVVHATASDVSSSESSYEDVHRRNVVHAAKHYDRRMADDMSASESSYEGEEHGQAAVIHAAAKDYDRHAARGNSAVVHCSAKNYDRHASRGTTAAARSAPKAVDKEVGHGNSNANHVEQNPTFNIQVPVTTSVAQTSPAAQGPMCPFCHKQTFIRQRKRIGSESVVWMICLCLFCWPFFWVPLVCPECKDTALFCSECHQRIN